MEKRTTGDIENEMTGAIEETEMSAVTEDAERNRNCCLQKHMLDLTSSIIILGQTFSGNSNSSETINLLRMAKIRNFG